MKLIIAGSRTLRPTDQDILRYIFQFLKKEILPASRQIEIVSGEAKGVDTSAKNFAKSWRLIYHSYPADWHSYGLKAGPIRNAEMAEVGDALLLIWDGKSRGSANMKKNMQKLGKPVYEVIIEKA